MREDERKASDHPKHHYADWALGFHHFEYEFVLRSEIFVLDLPNAVSTVQISGELNDVMMMLSLKTVINLH